MDYDYDGTLFKILLTYEKWLSLYTVINIIIRIYTYVILTRIVLRVQNKYFNSHIINI